MKTAVRILRGRLKGREGWIPGTLEERAARGVTKALVHVEGELPDLFATSSLETVKQLALGLDEGDRNVRDHAVREHTFA